MKGFFVIAILLASTFSSSASAHERKCKPVVTVINAVHPSDVVKSVGAFTKEATCRTVEGVGKILKGTGEILSAPFKSRFNWPEKRFYRWHKGHWHEIKPTPKLRINTGTPVETDTQFIPHQITPEEQETVVLFQTKF